MSSRSRKGNHAQTLVWREAVEWHLLLNEKSPTSQVKASFAQWMLHAVFHVHVFLSVARVFGGLRGVAGDKYSIDELVREAREDSGDERNVVPLRRPKPPE